MTRLVSLALAACVALCLAADAQGQPGPVGAADKAQVIDALTKALEQQYVFPEVAAKMAELIRKNLAAGRYEAGDDPRAFADALTEDLRSVSKDRHLRVRYAPERIREERAQDEAAKRAAEEARNRMERFSNYAFREVKILPGNLGYLKFDGFRASQGAFAVAVGAMAFLANCDALIVDLRDNGGGSGEMIQLLSSYFFDGDPKHLNSFYYRKDEKVEQTWTLPYVPGRRMPDTPIFVLTSSYTFSGAEEFTYNLKNMKRATIVGETTGGGAHPVRMEILTDDFVANVPFARAVNPISRANWEGTGIDPDVKVAADLALPTAQTLALETLVGREQDARVKAIYQWTLEAQRARAQPPAIDEMVLRSYAGIYGPRTITFEGGALHYQRANGRKMKMLPMAEDTFQFDEAPAFRLKFLTKDGQVVAVEGRYDDGTIDTTPRTK